MDELAKVKQRCKELEEQNAELLQDLADMMYWAAPHPDNWNKRVEILNKCTRRFREMDRYGASVQ